MRLYVQKSLANEVFKSIKDNKLEYFKKEIIKILEKQNDITKSFSFQLFMIEKSGVGVGHVSIYKDGSAWKKIQNNPPKWKCIRQAKTFNSETAGAKQSITKLINKVRDCKNTDELLDIVLFNLNRFTDENGQLLPIVDKLANTVTKQKLIIKGFETKGISFGDKVQDWIVNLAKEVGLNISGFRYRIDKGFENHTIKEHGNKKSEESRGQNAVTQKDLEKINYVIDNPDFAVAGIKHNGEDSIILIKNDSNGGSILVEEILKGEKNRALNSKTYWIMKNPVQKKMITNILKNNGRYDVSKIKIAEAVAANSTLIQRRALAEAATSSNANGLLTDLTSANKNIAQSKDLSSKKDINSLRNIDFGKIPSSTNAQEFLKFGANNLSKVTDKNAKQYGGLTREKFNELLQKKREIDNKPGILSPSDIEFLIDVNEKAIEDMQYQINVNDNEVLKNSTSSSIIRALQGLNQLYDWFDLSKNPAKFFNKQWKNFYAKHPEKFINGGVE